MRLFIILFFIFFSIAKGMSYDRIFKEGRNWSGFFGYYGQFAHTATKLELCDISIEIAGEIDGETLWKSSIKFEEGATRPDTVLYFYEKESKWMQYFPESDKRYLIFDFDATPGDYAVSDLNKDPQNPDELNPLEHRRFSIHHIERINIRGREYRRYILQRGESPDGPEMIYTNPGVIFIEGIGMNCDNLHGDWPDMINSYLKNRNFFDTLYENGEAIFTIDDFYAPTVSGLYNVTDNDNVQQEIYDLTGKKIQFPQKGSLYIQNGELKLAR